MTVGLTLVALMGLDTAFAGYRAAAGRTGHVRTGVRSVQAMLGAGALGWLAGALLFGTVAMLGGPTPDLVAVGGDLVRGYAVFGGVIGLGFVARAAPSIDLRSASSILVFGPLTLIRPFWIVAVAVWASWAALPGTLVVVVCGIALVLGIEQLLERVVYRPGGEAGAAEI